MLFNSYIFLFVYLPIVLLGYLTLKRLNYKLPIVWVVFTSLIYYGWWKPEYLVLLIASIIVNLILGKIILDQKTSKRTSKILLSFGIIFNLSLLGYFKYAGFFIDNINQLFSAGFPKFEVVLPIGISFITFQKIAFLVDAHRGAVKNFSVLNYLFFVTFFPQLIAGPITHHSEVMPQLKSNLSRDFKKDISIGLSIFIVGLFKKVAIADLLSTYSDAGYGMLHSGQVMDMASAWITILSYSLQLYFDFSAYSDMAIGLARMFGIVFPVNFNSPYKADSIIDFWRRWHMTLSRFLRDYLYIPLGGNRCSSMRRYFNLIAVMLVGGLWHGASWTFVAWGGVHGIALTLNHAWKMIPLKKYYFYHSPSIKAMSIFSTFVFVTLAWVPFRAESMVQVKTMLKCLFLNRSDGLGYQSVYSFIKIQILNLAGFMDPHQEGFMSWFKPHELWPSTLPANFLSTELRPIGLVLIICMSIVFLCPNTRHIFENFNPVLTDDIGNNRRIGILSVLDTRAAISLSFLLMISILCLAHVSPFLYFQF